MTFPYNSAPPSGLAVTTLRLINSDARYRNVTQTDVETAEAQGNHGITLPISGDYHGMYVEIGHRWTAKRMVDYIASPKSFGSIGKAVDLLKFTGIDIRNADDVYRLAQLVYGKFVYTSPYRHYLTPYGFKKVFISYLELHYPEENRIRYVLLKHVWVRNFKIPTPIKINENTKNERIIGYDFSKVLRADGTIDFSKFEVDDERLETLYRTGSYDPDLKELHAGGLENVADFTTTQQFRNVGDSERIDNQDSKNKDPLLRALFKDRENEWFPY